MDNIARPSKGYMADKMRENVSMKNKWKISHKTKQAVFIGDNERRLVTTVNSGDPDIDMDNARLIASAPELLEVCKQALKALKDYEIGYPEFNRATLDSLKQAIAKAEGR